MTPKASVTPPLATQQPQTPSVAPTPTETKPTTPGVPTPPPEVESNPQTQIPVTSVEPAPSSAATQALQPVMKIDSQTSTVVVSSTTPQNLSKTFGDAVTPESVFGVASSVSSNTFAALAKIDTQSNQISSSVSVVYLET